MGGSTFTFTVTPDHPHREQVERLLERARSDAQSLWDRVAEHNEAHPPDPERSTRISFYVGQTLELTDE
jgi:hypothetical protein